jgi:hypothetical protein
MKLKDKVKDVPVVSVDYAYMHPEAEEEDEAEKGMPILVTKDSRTKMVYSRVVPKKGLDDYAVGALKRITEELGYKKVVMKSDNEPSILQLKDLVRKETDVELVMEEVPVGDHAANGSVENAVKNIQGQFRVLKDALESRLGVRIQGDHVVVPWLVMHAGSVICRRRVDNEGMTPYRRWRGRPFNRPVAEFGECIWYLPANTAGINKYEVRWQEGVWLGIRMESGETIVGTELGVVKCRDSRRKPANGGRWNREFVDKIVGVPWEVYPGVKGSAEIRSRVRFPQEPGEAPRPIRGRDEYIPRRFRIQKGDLQKFGFTAGCPGCRAANRGLPATGHSEECRRRIQEELEKSGDSRIERESVRANKYFGELLEESEKKRQKTPEGQGGDPVQGGREGDDQRVDGDGQGVPGVQPRARDEGVLGEEGQPEKKARQDAAAASSEESAKEAVPMEEDRGIKRNEDDWTEFAMSLKKKAK